MSWRDMSLRQKCLSVDSKMSVRRWFKEGKVEIPDIHWHAYYPEFDQAETQV